MNILMVKNKFTLLFLSGWLCGIACAQMRVEEFKCPPDSARPGVYWYFMDGNLNKEEMVRDLESMKAVGLGNLVFLEVDVGVPRGPVKFMSDEWQGLFANAIRHAERLGLDVTLGAGPGWTGSGGPWVKAEESMQHLVFSITQTNGPITFDGILPIPEQRSTPWHQMKSPFYEDVVVYAFPACNPSIRHINEKALYVRNPYSSMDSVPPYLPARANYSEPDPSNGVNLEQLVELTNRLQPDGRLTWDVPAGDWTILRMGRRSTGTSTRPAPAPGVGFDHDKFDKVALENHFENYYEKLIERVGPRAKEHGWTAVHLDSWEMGAQNWTPNFRKEFKQRRGYDPQPYLVTFSGIAVESLEVSERFLWDMRLTAQDLVLENYAGHLKELGRKNGFELSIEPYDMNPTADLDLGAVADVPMCEFWSDGMGFDTSFSCIEATSIAHTMGRPIVSAEAFTALPIEAWRQYPWSMKNQGDWAFAMGINRFVYHTFAHKPLGDEYRPGMTMGPYGVHWDRGQTWWPLVKDYHNYITRSSHLLRQGVTVSDILYLTPEGAPHIFRPPSSALSGSGALADKKGYGFDGCSPRILMERASVRAGLIVFPEGTSYSLLVLPRFETMTPQLLKKIIQLVDAGATIFGAPPIASPSLSNYPHCDTEVKKLAEKLWDESLNAKGVVILDTEAHGAKELYPDYATLVKVFGSMSIPPDFKSEGPIRYGHRRTDTEEIYFIANTTNEKVATHCAFRSGKGVPQLWNPVTAEVRTLPEFTQEGGGISIPLIFEPYQSFFVIFSNQDPAGGPVPQDQNFPTITPLMTLTGAWQVAFNPARGGPEKITFNTLEDWTKHAESGIKYYSGIATYRKTFDLPNASSERHYLDLGTVHDMARVKLNGKELGTVWCAPWRIEMTTALKKKDNRLEIEVANRWANRMIGDQQAPDKDIRSIKFESGFLGGQEFKAGRYTFSTAPGHDKLLPSGLIGPVQIITQRK